MSLAEAKKPYETGYAVQKTLTAVATAYRFLGTLLAIGSVVACLAGGMWIAAGLGGMVVAAFIYGTGVLIQAIGELALAIFDTAAHTRVAIANPSEAEGDTHQGVPPSGESIRPQVAV